MHYLHYTLLLLIRIDTEYTPSRDKEFTLHFATINTINTGTTSLKEI